MAIARHCQMASYHHQYFCSSACLVCAAVGAGAGCQGSSRGAARPGFFALIQEDPQLEALWDGFCSIDPDKQAKVLQVSVSCVIKAAKPDISTGNRTRQSEPMHLWPASSSAGLRLSDWAICSRTAH